MKELFKVKIKSIPKLKEEIAKYEFKSIEEVSSFQTLKTIFGDKDKIGKASKAATEFVVNYIKDNPVDKHIIVGDRKISMIMKTVVVPQIAKYKKKSAEFKAAETQIETLEARLIEIAEEKKRLADEEKKAKESIVEAQAFLIDDVATGKTVIKKIIQQGSTQRIPNYLKIAQA